MSIVNSLALIYALRPSVVLIYVVTGGIISNVALTMVDRFILKKEDPIPEYILKETQINKKEIEILKKIIESSYGVTAEEIRVRAKAQRKVEMDNKKEEEDENKKRD